MRNVFATRAILSHSAISRGRHTAREGFRAAGSAWRKLADDRGGQEIGKDPPAEFYVMPGIVETPASFRLSKNDRWLKQDQRLRKLSDFCKIAENFCPLQV